MTFYEIIDKYGKGATDTKMKALSMCLSKHFTMMKAAHEDKYWALMRDVFGILTDGHYNEEFATHDVSGIEYTDRAGAKHKGAHWSMEQVKEATKDYKFPAGVNEWDIFVAANALYADLCKRFDDKQVLDAMHSFFFADEDWPGNNKVWHYMACKNSK